MQEILQHYDITPEKILALQSKIFDFYDIYKRDLPWRNTFDRYKVWISETMLQQTQAKRVIDYFARWLAVLPDIYTLASCPKLQLLQLRSGLGFNSRVLRLQQCAIYICEQFGGDMPRIYIELVKLPGIGPYTAGALMNFAYNTPSPMVDTNIRRILIAELDLPEQISAKELNAISYLVTPVDRANDWGNAMMDYGALYFTAQKSGISPVSKQSRFAGSQRQVRGWIIKQLTQQSALSIDEIFATFPRDDLQEILAKMMQDGLISVQGNTVALDG